MGLDFLHRKSSIVQFSMYFFLNGDTNTVEEWSILNESAEFKARNYLKLFFNFINKIFFQFSLFFIINTKFLLINFFSNCLPADLRKLNLGKLEKSLKQISFGNNLTELRSSITIVFVFGLIEFVHFSNDNNRRFNGYTFGMNPFYHRYHPQNIIINLLHWKTAMIQSFWVF